MLRDRVAELEAKLSRVEFQNARDRIHKIPSQLSVQRNFTKSVEEHHIDMFPPENELKEMELREGNIAGTSSLIEEPHNIRRRFSAYNGGKEGFV